MIKENLARNRGHNDEMNDVLNAINLEKPLATVKVDESTVIATMDINRALIMPMMMMMAF